MVVPKNPARGKWLYPRIRLGVNGCTPSRFLKGLINVFYSLSGVKGWIFSERRTESGRIVAELVGGLG